ncbi:MAG: EAL domain-containing protein [Dehalococcoidia bacterium]
MSYSVRGLLWGSFLAMVAGAIAAIGAIWYEVSHAASAHDRAEATAARLEVVEAAKTSALEEQVMLGLMALPSGRPSAAERQRTRAAGLAAAAAIERAAADDALPSLSGLAPAYYEAVASLDELWLRFDSGDIHGAISGLVDGGAAERLDALRARLNAAASAESAVFVAAQQAERDAWRGLMITVVVTAVAGILGLLAAGMLISRAIVGPVHSIAAIADQVAQGDVRRRARPRGPREVRSLAASVNRMCESLIGRSRELQAYLERNLEARTADLERSNLELALEVEGRTVAERAARAGEEQLRLILDTTPEILVLVGEGGEIAFVSSAYDRLVGASAASIIGSPVGALFDLDATATPVDDAGLLGALLAKPEQLRLRTSAGVDPRDVEVEGFRSASGAEIIILIRDVTEQRRAQATLRERAVAEEALRARIAHQAYHDPLTDLPNRSLLTSHLSEALATGGPLALLFIDLDDFKSINDTLGHEAGDRALVIAAERLRQRLPRAAFAARLGGDEFAVVLHGESAPEAEPVASALLLALREPLEITGTELYLRASIGIARAEGQDVAEILRQADVAMYYAKSRGKSRFATFDVAMDADTSSALALLNDLERSLAREEFELHYQPVVHLETGMPVGVEALVRWRHPEHGLLLPGRFIPLAETSGRIRELDRWSLRRACRDACDWLRTGAVPPSFTVSVNISAADLFESDFVASVQAALTESGLPARNLIIELTESAVLRDADVAFATLQSLRSRGVRIALDDFGTGYSSLSYLSRMPIDILKVDRSFIGGALSDSRGQELASSIVALAHRLGYSVVAEGVEVESQSAWLRQIGCTLGQGHMFLRAVEVADLIRYLKATPAVRERRVAA